MEEAMGREWPAQLDRAAEEHGWCEKNLKKRYCGEPWTLDAAKKVRVDLPEAIVASLQEIAELVP